MFIFLWIVSGILGAMALRKSYCMDISSATPYWCLSPFEYLLFIIAAPIAGMLAFFVGGGMFLSSCVEHSSDSSSSSWFFRPICKK